MKIYTYEAVLRKQDYDCDDQDYACYDHACYDHTAGGKTKQCYVGSHWDNYFFFGSGRYRRQHKHTFTLRRAIDPSDVLYHLSFDETLS